jgi:hypothetical protein
MNFPPYVPNAVRTRVARMLDGPRSWSAALEHANAALTRLNELRTGNPYDDRLRIEHSEALAHRDYVADQVICLQRLVYDERMRSAYAHLLHAITSDEQLAGFIDAAWATKVDYSEQRDRMRAAAELAQEVARAAGVLGELLKKAEGFAGPLLPSAFFSIRSLLELTEHDCDHRDFHFWSRLRRCILGQRDPPSTSIGEVAEMASGSGPMRIEMLSASTDDEKLVSPDVEQRDTLNYAWGTAPSLARMIASLQRVAIAYETAAATGAIDAALAGRQRNSKTEYLRAFGWQLRYVHGLECTPDIVNAIAITATVVLNDADKIVTYDDVRKSILKRAV